MKFEVLPSILTPDRQSFLDRVFFLKRKVKRAQLDVLDNTLVSNKDFFDPKLLASLHLPLKLEVHLMVSDPVRQVLLWDYPFVEKILFHIEAPTNPNLVIKRITRLKKRPGLAVNPTTSIAKIRPYLGRIDTVLVMTVHPGRNGAKFLPAMVKKIAWLRAHDNRVNIEVDGGINAKTARLCLAAGANILVAGSYLSNRNFNTHYSALKKIINEV